MSSYDYIIARKVLQDKPESPARARLPGMTPVVVTETAVETTAWVVGCRLTSRLLLERRA